MEKTLWRLRRLQSNLKESECLLAVLGADGRDNVSSLALLRWLVLGESFQSESNTLPLSAKESALEETVLIVSKESLSILYDAKTAEHDLAPLLRCPIARLEYVLPETDDIDERQDAKIRLFAKMVQEQPRALGIGLPRGQEDAIEEIEFWPIVQSYALDTNTYTPGGFFSQHYHIFDATTLMWSVIARPDASSLSKSLSRGTSALDQMCNQVATLIAQDKLQKACEELRALDEDDPNAPVKSFVLSASTAVEQLGDWRLPEKCKTTSSTTKKNYVFQVSESASGLALCRTYLDSEAPAETTQHYLALINALHAAWPRTLKRLGTDSTEREFTSDLKQRLLASLDRGIASRDLAVLVRIHEETVYIRAALALEDNATCVAVGDTFLLLLSEDTCPLPLAQGEMGLLTGDRGGSPYLRPSHNLQLIRTVRDDPRSLGLNAPLMQMPGAALYAVLNTPDNKPSASIIYCGRLQLFENGFVITERTGSIVAVSMDQIQALASGFPASAHDNRFVLEMEFFLDKSRNSFSLPCGAGSVQAAALLVKRNSETHRQVRDLLPQWRSALRAHSQQTLYSDQREYEQACSKVNSSARLDRAIQLLGDQSINVLPTHSSELPQALVNSLESLAESEAEACLRALDAKPMSISTTNSNATSVYFMLGVPGSGCEELAAGLVRRGGWRLVQTQYHDDDDDELDVAATAAALKAAHDDKDKTPILLTGRCAASAAAFVVQSIKQTQFELAGGAVVASCAQLQESEDLFEGEFWPPALWLQCVPGLTTSLVVVKDFASPKSKLLERRARAQAKSVWPRLVEIRRGDDSGLALLAEALLRPDEIPALSTKAAISARRHVIYEKNIASSSGHIRRLDFAYDLDYHLVLKLLTHVLLPEKCVLHARALGLGSTNTDNKTENSKPVLKTLFSLAKSKVEAKQRAASRLAGLDLEIEAWRQANPDTAESIRESIAGLSGSLCVEIEGKKIKGSLAIDGNRKALSLWPGSHTNHSSLVFFGSKSLPSTATLNDLFALASSRRIRPRPHRALANLTSQDVDFVLKSNTERPLPSGWAFDGNLYVDTYGNRSKRRPDANELLSEWIQAENSSIDNENRTLAL